MLLEHWSAFGSALDLMVNTILVLAFLSAFVAIYVKIINHIRYLNKLPDSTELNEYFWAFAPLFMSNKEEEIHNVELGTLATKIRRSLWVFYIGIIIFFGGTAF